MRMAINNSNNSPLQKQYDLLSSDGTFVRVGTKEDAQNLGLYRPTVHIFLFDDNEKLLICRRPPTARVYANLWSSSAGGHVELGEKPEHAAARELREELSIELELIYVGNSVIEMPERKNIQHLYAGRLNSETIKPSSDEISEWKFLPVESIINEISSNTKFFTTEFVKALALYKEKTEPQN